MNDRPEHMISEISEIPDRASPAGLWHFFAAVGWGAGAATACLVIGVLVANLPDTDILSFLGGSLFVAIYVAFFTCVGMFVIGLPVTVGLRLLRRERQGIYAAIGAISGFLVLSLLFGRPIALKPESFLLSGAGAVAGFASAWRWGRWREAATTTKHEGDRHIADQQDD